MKYARKLGLGFLPLLFLTLVFSPLALPPRSASAAPGWQYIDRAFYSEVAGGVLDDSDIERAFGNDTYTETFANEGAFRAQGIGYNCDNAADNPVCESYYILHPAETSATRTVFTNYCNAWPSGNRNDCPNVNRPTSGSNQIIVERSDYNTGTRYSYTGATVDTIQIADPFGALADVQQQFPPTSAPPAAGGGDDERDTEFVSCETRAGELGWILCPIILMLDSAFNWLDTQIQELLSVTENKYTDPNLYKAWASIRNIAYAVLIPIMLVMVLGTALGFEIFSAYTVKRALPRMVIAVIFIALSWNIAGFMINFFNVVGAGVLGVMTSPFEFQTVNDAGETINKTVATLSLADLYGVMGVESYAELLLTQVIAFVGVLALLVFFLGSVVMILLISFALLLFRQILIVALMLLAPLAILAWIFPGNDKLWKLWWGSFTKLLMMFPIIMAILAVGRIFAFIIANDTEGVADSILRPTMALFAYAAVYGFIPLSFRLAGGFFATLTGMANDRSKGFFDKQKQKRAARFTRAQNNALFRPGSRMGRLNNAASWLTDPFSNAAYKGRGIPGLRGKGRAIQSALEGAASEQSGKLFQELNEKFKFNDKAYRALSGSYNGFTGDTRRRLVQEGLATYMRDSSGNIMRDEKGDEMVEGRAPNGIGDFNKLSSVLSRSGSETERIAANVLSGAAGRLTTLHDDPEMGRANLQAAGIMGLSAHGFANGEDLAVVGNSMMRSGVTSDLAQSYINGAQVLGQRSRPDVKAGYGVVFTSDGRFVSGISPEGGRARDLIKTLSAMDVASAKGGAIKALKPTINEMLAGPSAALRARVDAGTASDKELETYNVQLGEQQAVLDQLMSWAGPYSQASVDVKQQAIQIINEAGLGGELDRRRRVERSAEERGEFGGGGGEEEPH